MSGRHKGFCSLEPKHSCDIVAELSDCHLSAGGSQACAEKDARKGSQAREVGAVAYQTPATV